MAPDMDDLGAWSDERQQLSDAPVSGRGSDADIPETLRFSRAVTQLVAKRERRTDASYDQSAAFVLVPPAWNESRPATVRRNPRLHTGTCELTGRIHLTSAVLVGSSMSYEGDDADLFAALEQLGVQHLPAILYAPSESGSTLTLYPNGVADEAQYECWDVAEVIPTLDAITQVIDRVYHQDLITPDQSKKFSPWKDPKRGWAHKDAEDRVQHAVKCGLAGAFRQCSIRPEQPGKVGRTDLEIVTDEQRPADQIEHHAVLELKVLRHKGSTGDTHTDEFNHKHMRDGVQQAFAYGEKRSMRERLLCCFDMRESDAGDASVFSPVADEAAQLKVSLRRWFLYRSSALMRSAMATAVTGAPAR